MVPARPVVPANPRAPRPGGPDGLPLIGVALTAADSMALTAAEWRAVCRAISRKNGLSAGSEMFAWMLDSTGHDQAAATFASLPATRGPAFRWTM